MNLYKCGPDDLDDIIMIGRKTYYDSFHTLNSDETMQQYLDEAFERTKIERELMNPQSGFFFLYDNDSYDNDSPVAYIKTNLPPAQTDLNDKGSLELERIYVKSGHKGKGYGKYLIEETLSMASELDCDYVWLGVWEKNEEAIAFYRKMGFVIFDRHTFRMGDEIQNDFVLKKNI